MKYTFTWYFSYCKTDQRVPIVIIPTRLTTNVVRIVAM